LQDVVDDTGITKILLIQQQWLDQILYNGKRMELRGKNVHFRGSIGLAWRGKLFATATLVDSFLVDDEWKQNNFDLHKVADPASLQKYSWAWRLEDVKVLEFPVEFDQPNGAVTWVSVKAASGSSEPSQSSYDLESPSKTSQAASSTEHAAKVHVLKLAFAFDCFLFHWQIKENF